MKINWALVWSRFDDAVYEAEGDAGWCKECGHSNPAKYDDWQAQQKLIQRLVDAQVKAK